MRQCKCGGVIRQHQLVNNREAWTCNACGRYEVVELEKKEDGNGLIWIPRSTEKNR